MTRALAAQNFFFANRPVFYGFRFASFCKV